MSIANVLAVANREQEGLEQYRKALELDPNSSTAHLYLGPSGQAHLLLEGGVTRVALTAA
jgi:hypothetical protein